MLMQVISFLVWMLKDPHVLCSILPSLSRQSKLEGCIEELELMQGEIAKLEKRKKALNVAFEAMLGLENKFEDELTRVFKKKVKRVKKNEQTESKGEGTYNVQRAMLSCVCQLSSMIRMCACRRRGGQ